MMHFPTNWSGAENNVDSSHSYLIGGYSVQVLVWISLERLFNRKPEKIAATNHVGSVKLYML